MNHNLLNCTTDERNTILNYFYCLYTNPLNINITMGDITTIVTLPRYPNSFYKVTSNALHFGVKSSGNIAVGLAHKPGNRCDFWIILNHNGRCWIKKEGAGMTEKVLVHDYFSSEEFRKFWISWYGNCVCFGRYGEVRPLVRYMASNTDLSYVTFSVIDDRGSATWIFELPPVLDQPSLKPINGHEPYWIAADTQLPDDALVGGYEKETLYIIRGTYRGSLAPGKFVPSQGLGFIAWGGAAREKNEFEVLCGFNCIWVPTSKDKIPVGAVEAGFSEVNREKLYVGRIVQNNHIIPGKVQPSHKVCYVAYEGREVGSTEYEILVVPKQQVCANQFMINHIDVDVDSEEEFDHLDSDNDEQEPHAYIF